MHIISRFLTTYFGVLSYRSWGARFPDWRRSRCRSTEPLGVRPPIWIRCCPCRHYKICKWKRLYFNVSNHARNKIIGVGTERDILQSNVNWFMTCFLFIVIFDWFLHYFVDLMVLRFSFYLTVGTRPIGIPDLASAIGMTLCSWFLCELKFKSENWFLFSFQIERPNSMRGGGKTLVTC